MKITRTMQHTLNLHAVRQRTVKNEVIAEPLHTPPNTIVFILSKKFPEPSSLHILPQIPSILYKSR